MGLIRLFSRQKPKIKVQSSKKDGFSGWVKCTGCAETIHTNELKNNLNCCPKCNYHYRLSIKQRISLLVDEDTYKEKFEHIHPTDPLNFEDQEKYKNRIVKAQEKTGRSEAVATGVGKINKIETAIAIMDFSFMGGSMGSVVGEKLTLLIEYAIDHHLPVVIVSSSGGARMQESIFSLMQMAKTSAALANLGKKGLPFISILTNPTMGGVTASFASLGDVIIAEPKALIGFAGPRVVEQTIRQKLPEGAQRSEFLLEKGLIDLIVSRKYLKEKLSFILYSLLGNDRKIKSVKKLNSHSSTQNLKDLVQLSKSETEKV